MIDDIGGRKFILTASTGAVSTVLVWFGKISGDVYAAIILGVVATYIAGNVIQYVKGSAK